MVINTKQFVNWICKALMNFVFDYFRKVSREQLYEVIEGCLKGSIEKKRNFLETVELQVALKNYDPQKDKRFSGTVKYEPSYLVVSPWGGPSPNGLKYCGLAKRKR